MTTASIVRQIRLAAAAALATAAATAAAAVVLASPAQAADVRLHGVKSDNYKASYNAGGTAENRTWMAIESLTIDGNIYCADAAATWFAQGPVRVYGSTLAAPDITTISFERVSGPGNDAPLFRVDPANFGPLAMVTDKAQLATTPITYRLTVTRDTVVVATFEVTYRREAAFAAPTAGTPQYIEANGPGGRWFVDGAATPMDWENAPGGSFAAKTTAATTPAPTPTSGSTAPSTTTVTTPSNTGSTSTSTSTSTASPEVATIESPADSDEATTVVPVPAAASTLDRLAPRIIAATLRRAGASRMVRIALRASDSSGVVAVRTANEGKGWSGWRAFAQGRPVEHQLTRGAGRKVVYVQVRDAAGNVSKAKVLQAQLRG